MAAQLTPLQLPIKLNQKKVFPIEHDRSRIKTIIIGIQLHKLFRETQDVVIILYCVTLTFYTSVIL